MQSSFPSWHSWARALGASSILTASLTRRLSSPLPPLSPRWKEMPIPEPALIRAAGINQRVTRPSPFVDTQLLPCSEG